MPGIRYVEQNLFLAYIMLDKTYSLHKYVPQNLFLAYVMLDKTTLWNLFVKICKTRCFLSKKIIFEIINRVFLAVITVALRYTIFLWV